MFFLGHMCWGYVFGKATSHLRTMSEVPEVVRKEILQVC